MSRVVLIVVGCAVLSGCLTAYKLPENSGPSASLQFASPTYSSSLLSTANLTLSISRVDPGCRSTHLGWIKYDPKKPDDVHYLAADKMASIDVSYDRTTLFAGNLSGRTGLVFFPKPGEHYTLEFVTDDKTFDAKLYREAGGQRVPVRTAESVFDVCRFSLTTANPEQKP